MGHSHSCIFDQCCVVMLRSNPRHVQSHSLSWIILSLINEWRRKVVVIPTLNATGRGETFVTGKKKSRHKSQLKHAPSESSRTENTHASPGPTPQYNNNVKRSTCRVIDEHPHDVQQPIVCVVSHINHTQLLGSLTSQAPITWLASCCLLTLGSLIKQAGHSA